jgi:hypothetical protein
MSVTEPTARRYSDDETFTDMARRMLFEFVDEQPGADLMQVPRTVPMSLILVGTTIAALAEAIQDPRGKRTSPTGRRCPGSGRSPPRPAQGR